jgi:hypothetical protein
MKTTLLLAITLNAVSAFAQQPPQAGPAPAAQVDARFAAWLGCWRLDDDLSGTGARMCITPEKGGVRMQTVAGSQRGIDELVIPDGVVRPIVDAECKGTEKSEWSKDGARVFRTTDVTCEKESPRTITSVAFMAAGPSWINVQHLTGTLSSTSVRVQRYRRAYNQQLADGSKAPQPEASLTTRTTPEVTKWSVEDVIEASGKLPIEAMQAALTEVRQPFELNSKALVALDDSGVDDSVIDLMVALSYPQRFVVERAGGGGGSTSGISMGTGWFDPFMSPMLMGGLSNCYTPYGYGYRSYYSMCGIYSPYYGYGYGYGYPYYGNGYGWITVPPATGSGGGGSVTPIQEGRVVNGRGYTQIRNRDAEPSPRISSGNGGGSSGGGGGATSSGYSSGSSSSGSSGSSGGSSGGSSSGARTAVPKGGGH